MNTQDEGICSSALSAATLKFRVEDGVIALSMKWRAFAHKKQPISGLMYVNQCDVLLEVF
jgi:hypothetical protein